MAPDLATSDALAAALAREHPHAAALAESLHVLGDSAPLWLAAELAGLPRDDASAAADALVRAGLLTSADPLRMVAPDAWAALSAATAGAQRNAAHGRAARLLARTADGLDAAAGHLLRIPPTGEEWAATILRDAAAAAVEEGRADAATAALQRALEEPVERALRVDLLAELGAARDLAGAEGAEAAIDAYRQALRLAERSRRPELHLALGRSLYGAGLYRDAGLALDRGLEEVEDRESPVAIGLLAAYVAAARFDSTLEDAAGEHLAPLLGESGAGRTAAERALLAELSLERGIRGQPRDTVVRLALRAWADGLLLEGADPYGIALSQVAAALTWSDAFADSIRVLSATVDWAQRTGTAQLEATARYLRAWPRWYTGALDAAEADARFALAAPGWEMYEPSARAILGHVLVERGAHAEAWTVLAMEAAHWQRTIPYAMLLETRARLHVAAGDLDKAAVDLLEAGSLLETIGNRSAFCPWRSRLAWVVAHQGDVARGEALVAEELELAAAIGAPRALGFALHVRGQLARLLGRDGLVDLTEAVSVLAGCGARLEQARALLGLGSALATDGRREAARAPLHEAHVLAQELGARELVDQAARTLRAVGGRPPAETGGPHGLTASELRVAQLAARGRTNRQIADELVVSPHTVRFHLSGVYRKLGVTARDEIAPALERAAPAQP